MPALELTSFLRRYEPAWGSWESSIADLASDAVEVDRVTELGHELLADGRFVQPIRVHGRRVANGMHRVAAHVWTGVGPVVVQTRPLTPPWDRTVAVSSIPGGLEADSPALPGLLMAASSFRPEPGIWVECSVVGSDRDSGSVTMWLHPTADDGSRPWDPELPARLAATLATRLARYGVDLADVAVEVVRHAAAG